MANSTGRRSGAGHWADIAQAYRTRSWKQLGYSRWADYVRAEWDVPRIPSPDRKDIAEYLLGRGLSLTAVAEALRVSCWTVRADLQGPRLPRPRTERMVYVIGSDEFRPVKIGTGSDLPRRLSDLQVGNPFLLTVRWTVPGDESLERQLHQHFDPYRITGEWFEFPEGEDVVDAISSACLILTGAPGERAPDTAV